MRKACYHGHIEIVQFCLDNGANVDACHGQALVYACKNGYLEIVKLLLKRKADVNVDSGKPMLKTIQRGNIVFGSSFTPQV
jgi:ankyrin repeat protein